MQEYISYSDPDARVIKTAQGFHRLVYQSYRVAYDQLMSSGLYDDLTAAQLMIRHKELNNHGAQGAEVYKVLYPEQIPFLSHPFEWSFAHWRAAFLAYLKINQMSIAHGMILKDANPFNFGFWKGKPVLIDTTSFMLLSDSASWRAYTQFCSFFLAPLALMRYKGVTWGALLKGSIRGFDLPFVSRQLPARSWFNVSVLLHIHLHARTKANDQATSLQSRTKSILSAEKLQQIHKMLESTVLSWETPVGTSIKWDAYYLKDIQSTSYVEAKEALIKDWLSDLLPESVVDLGANTGRFSFLAADYSKRVIALESDERCVAAIEKQIEKAKASNVFAAIADFQDVVPGLGLMGREFQGLIERAQSSCAMALALVHHLYIVNRMGFELMTAFFEAWTTSDLIIEFIPLADDKVQLLLSGRSRPMNAYSESSFVNAMKANFNLIKRVEIAESKRVLFHFSKQQQVVRT